jgi:hypothetical protein
MRKSVLRVNRYPPSLPLAPTYFYRPCVTPCAKVRLLFGTERLVCVYVFPVCQVDGRGGERELMNR